MDDARTSLSTALNRVSTGSIAHVHTVANRVQAEV
jgi:hypothetical protein